MASEKQEALNALKSMSKESVVSVGKKYMTGGGFGDINKMTKGQIIDILMSGKTSYYKVGGMAKKKMRGGGMAGKAKAAKKMMRGGMAKKKMRGGGMAKMAQKKMMRGGMAKKKMMRGGAVKKK